MSQVKSAPEVTKAKMKETVRRTVLLLCAAVFCLSLLVLGFTDIGMGTLFRLNVRLHADTVDISDYAHLEYYDVRGVMDETDSYRIFLCGDVALSYDAALDFLKFVKQNDEIGVVRLATDDPDGVNAYLASGEESSLPEDGLSEGAKGFLRALYTYNQKLPPQKRVTVAAGDAVVGKGEYVLTDRSYDRSDETSGVLSVSMIYPGREGCDPLFNVPKNGFFVSLLKFGQSIAPDLMNRLFTDTPFRDSIRFGSAKALEKSEKRLEAVSGNFGRPVFDGLNQPAFYFLIEDVR